MMRNSFVFAMICFTAASLTAAHPVRNRRSPGCTNSWPPEAVDCSVASQPTPLSIKRMIVFAFKAQQQLSPFYSTEHIFCDAGCSNPLPQMEAGVYCETPAFALNPHYAMSDTESFNLDSYGLLAQRLAWSISDHYSSLESFAVNILNSSNSTSDTPNMELLANVSSFVQKSLLPDISGVNFQGTGCPAHTVTLLNYSDISCASPSDQVYCFGLQLAFTLKSFRNHIKAYLNLEPNHELKAAVDKVPDCAVYGSDPLTPREFRKMTCRARQLTSEAYHLVKALPVTSAVNCSEYSSGVTSWLGYFEEGLFPPTTPLNMTVYPGYLKSIMEHRDALSAQASSLASANLGDSLSTVSNFLSDVIPRFQQWLSSKACDCTNSVCELPSSVTIDPASIATVGRTEYYKQLYCQVQDLRSTAESTYLFFTLLPEAFNTWSVPCSAV